MLFSLSTGVAVFVIFHRVLDATQRIFAVALESLPCGYIYKMCVRLATLPFYILSYKGDPATYGR